MNHYMTVPKLRGMIIFVGLMIPLAANAAWVRYDNFDGTAIDTTKWTVDDSSATISVAGGKAIFVTKPGNYDDSAWLIIKQDVANIKGVRMRARLAKGCVEFTRVRAGGYVGERGGERMFGQVFIRSRGTTTGDEEITAVINVEDLTGNYLRDDLFANFPWLPGTGSAEVTGKYIQLNMQFSNPGKFRAWTTYQPGQVARNHLMWSAVDAGELFMGVGTRTSDRAEGGPTGSCTAWIDFVDVLK